MSEAAELKEEGNRLFVDKNYAAAAIKYTEALAIDENNAVLYANRAACRLQLKQYLDAKSDAVKATEIDPLYAKAWARMATAHDALGNWQHSIDAWERALDVLPKENLSSAELKQKQQYADGLRTANNNLSKLEAKARKGKPGNAIGTRMEELNLVPWRIAETMIPDLLKRQHTDSCAWSLAFAYKEYTEGVNLMKSIKRTTVGNRVMVTGSTGSIQMMTNGLLRDCRVFYVDGPDWMTAFDNRVALDMDRYKDWIYQGPQQITEDALVRQREKGWDDVRPALATTIRTWIMRGFLDFRVKDNPKSAVEFLSRSLEVLNWGRTVWKDVPRDDRGTIFDLTFVIGVHNLYIHALLEAYGADRSDDTALETLYNEASDLVQILDDNPYSYEKYSRVDTGFQWSFFGYPKANALSAQGLYHVILAQRLEALQGDHSDEIVDHYIMASRLYLDAADKLPSDDEEHPWFLKCSLQYFGTIGVTVKLALQLMERIRLSVPKMKKLWNRHPNFVKPSRDAVYEQIKREENKLKNMRSKGEVSLDAVIKLYKQ